MEDNLKALLVEVASIKERLSKIEAELFPNKAESSPTVELMDDNKSIEEKSNKHRKPSNVLGYVGASCLLFAIILLIKFSIDSGWLTPSRQMLIATLFGLSLTVVPIFSKIKDRTYLSLLPAVGLTSLHLTIYGSVFYHSLLNPQIGLACTSIVGFLSLWMLSRFKEETYAVMAVGGTYIGAILLKVSFISLDLFAYYLFAWNIIFSVVAIKLKMRSLIALAAYFSLIIVAIASWTQTSDFRWQIVSLQIIQMIIYSVFLALFTVKNRIKLTQQEAWKFFPVYMFFYGHTFYMIDKINPHYATAFAILFSLGLLALLHIAKQRLHEDRMTSSPVIYSFIAVVLAHSLFFVAMNDFLQFTTVAIILLVFRLVQTDRINTNFKGVGIVLMILVAYAMLSLSFRLGTLADWTLSAFGFVYGVVILSIAFNKATSLKIFKEVVLIAAHSQMVCAVYRLKEFVGEYGVPLLWVAYAFIFLYRGMRTKNATYAKSVFPIIFISITYFMFNSFKVLGQGQRIISLLILGGLIYACGYFYRKIIRETEEQV